MQTTAADITFSHLPRHTAAPPVSLSSCFALFEAAIESGETGCDDSPLTHNDLHFDLKQTSGSEPATA